jgi:hypothetical protein
MHTHVIGSTGKGKSRFLEWSIKKDLQAGRSVFLFDYHGSLIHNLIGWLVTHGFHRPVILYQSDDTHIPPFNPLLCPPHLVPLTVDTMVETCAKVWKESQYQTPTLRRTLRAIFHVLAENNLTILESQYLFDKYEGARRKRFIITDPIMLRQWLMFEEMSDREWRDTFVSATNRIMEFIGFPFIRYSMGQQRTLDFAQAMDDHALVLVDLSIAEQMSESSAHLLGTMLLSNVYLNVKLRKNTSPTSIYIDEAQFFVNDDLAKMLTEFRKFHVDVTISHQMLSQLKDNPKVFSAVMGNTGRKIVFGGLGFDEAMSMAREMFHDSIDLTETKLTRPTITGYETVESEVRTIRTSSRSGSSVIHNPAFDDPMMSSNEGDSIDEGVTISDRNEAIFEDLPSSVFSLGEQLFKKASFLMALDKQTAMMRTDKLQLLRVPDVPDPFISPERIIRYRKTCLTNYQTISQIEKEILARLPPVESVTPPRAKKSKKPPPST